MSQHHPVFALILNGKNTDNDVLRSAVQEYRKAGFTLHVRVTWEHGDAKRYVEEAMQLTVYNVIDGTINEVASALVQCALAQHPTLRISSHSAQRMILPPVVRSRLMSNMH